MKQVLCSAVIVVSIAPHALSASQVPRAAEHEQDVPDAGEDNSTEQPPANWDVGYKKGFFVKSPERNFRLRIDGQAQVRYLLDVRQGRNGTRNRNDFEMRRFKLKFSGNIFGPSIKYAATISRHRDTGDITLQSIHARFALTDELQLKVGNFRPAFLREEGVSSKRQLLAERSTIARRFRQDFTLGISLRYKNKFLRMTGGFFQPTRNLGKSDTWLVVGRAEALLLGKWKRLADFTSFRDDKPAIMVGSGIQFRHEDIPTGSGGDEDLVRWTLDASMEIGGSNIAVAIVGNQSDRDAGPDLSQYGLLFQGGTFLTDWLELFARYEYGDADVAAPDLSIITVGFNGYINEHRMKVTTDFGYATNEVAGLWSSSATGWKTDRSGDDGQFLMRVQFQLLF